MGFRINVHRPDLSQGQTTIPASSPELQVGGHGVVEEQEVHAVQVVQLLLVEGVDVVEELRCHVPRGPGALGGGGEGHLVFHPGQPQHIAGVLLQRLVLAHHIVVDEAGVAKRVHSLPVLIEGLLVLRGRVHQVVHKLRKRHIIARLYCFGLRVRPVALHDLGAVALVEGRVVAARKLIAIGRHQPLEGLAHKHKLEVGAQPLVDLSRGV